MSISKQFIAKLIQSISLQEHISKSFDVKRSGHNAVAKCPFHDDSSPSLYIYPDNYHCFACKAHGNIIDFEIHQKNISFREAVVALADQYHLEIQFENENPQNPQQIKIDQIVSQGEQLQKAFQLEFSKSNVTPIKQFLETQCAEVGFVKCVDELRAWRWKNSDCLKSIERTASFHSFPFQTEKGKVFGFLFTQLEIEPNLNIPIETQSFVLMLSDDFQPIVNFPQARRHVTNRSLILVAHFFEFFLLLKHGVKNVVLAKEKSYTPALYSFLSKYISKLFLFLDEKNQNVFCTYDQLSILIRWIPKQFSDKIDLYKTLRSDTIFQWILSAQKQKNTQKESEEEKKTRPKESSKININLFDKTIHFYHRILLHPSNANIVEYLHTRGLSLDDINKWKLGFCPRDSVLARSLLKQNVDTTPFIQLGLLGVSQKTKRLYDFFYNRVVFPIANHQGKFVALGGRIVVEDVNYKSPKYINSSETSLFSKSQLLFHFFEAMNAIVETGYAIVVEGFMDCITLVNHGIKNTVAVMGTALTTEHLSTLAQITQRVVLCFDTDSAGKNAVKKSFLSSFKFPELNLETISLPTEKDPDAFVKKYGPEEFLTLINNHALPVYQSVIQWIQEESSDSDEFLINLKLNFKYVEFQANSHLGQNISNLLLQIYDLRARDVFVKHAHQTTSRALQAESTDSLASHGLITETSKLTAIQLNQTLKLQTDKIPKWSLHNLTELKIIFLFFYCPLRSLPTKFIHALKEQQRNFEHSQQTDYDLFYDAFENQISESGRFILQELFLHCQKNEFQSCDEIPESAFSALSELSQILVAYLKRFVTTLMKFEMNFLLDSYTTSDNQTSAFDATKVWSPKNVMFLRLQRKNAELSKTHLNLTSTLMELLVQLELDEIDAQLKDYSKTHFNHALKEKFVHLIEARSTRANLF